ncbi:acyl carrier protein [Nitrospira sp. Nam80]
MNPTRSANEIRQAVIRILGDIAPEADLQALKPELSFRDQLDIDSMDFLNFIIALHRELGIEIPETDYPKYSSLQGCIDHLSSPI